MTDIREDPTGYSIVHTGEREWRAIRLVDNSTVPGKASTRDKAIDLAIKDSDTPGGYVKTS